jgi:hypothetical protein
MIKKAFGDNAMSEAQIKLWYRRLKDGRKSVESDRRSGRPPTSRTPENVENVRAIINENQRLTVRELGEDLGIPQIIVSQILTESWQETWRQNFFFGSCHESRRNVMLQFHRAYLKPLTVTHIFSKRS